MTHIFVSELTIIGSDNGLSPGRRQAMIWTNAGILLIGPLGTNFSEILIRIQTFSFKKLHLKTSSAKWRLFCLGLNELMNCTNPQLCNIVLGNPQWYIIVVQQCVLQVFVGLLSMTGNRNTVAGKKLFFSKILTPMSPWWWMTITQWENLGNENHLTHLGRVRHMHK